MNGATGYTWQNLNRIASDCNKIYIIPETAKASCCWLASPSSDGSVYVESVRSNYNLNSCHYEIHKSCGVRPIVSLKSGIQLEKKSEGVYSIK